MEHTATFIQPLLDANEAWAGFMVETSKFADLAESEIPALLFEGIKKFDKRLPWYVPAALIAPPSNPPASVIPLFCAEANPLQTEQAAAFRQANRQLGLSAQASLKLPESGDWDYLLISCPHAKSLPPYTLIAMALKTAVIATDTRTHDERQWSLKNGCKATTAEYLGSPYGDDKKADINHLRLLELLSLIVADADTPQLEAILRQEAKLSYSLLRLVNSAAIAPRNPISSFSQAINLLGRRQLQRWLQLLVYADTGNHHSNPLLPKAAHRGRVCELIATSLGVDFGEADIGDTAFMIGAFSQLDILLKMRMHDILQHLPLPAAAREALGERSGVIGKLLTILDAADRRDIDLAASQLAELPISAETFITAQLDSLLWASKIHPS